MREALAGFAETIATAVTIEHNRCIHPVAQILQIARKRRARDFQLGKQIGKRHHAAIADQQFNLVETFGRVHVSTFPMLIESG